MPAVAWTARAACAALALVAIPAVATDAYYQRLDPSRRFGFGVARNRFPIRAMAFATAEGLPGPILADLVDSNYVLFDRGPASVDVDGRLEVYGGDIVKQADDLFKTGNGFDDFVARCGVSTVLVAQGTDGNLFRTVNRRDDWAPVYFDETHTLFVRVTPETRALVAARRIDWSAPVRAEAAVPAWLDPPDWLAGLWPRVKDDVGEKALGQLALLTGNLPLARDRFAEALAVRPDDADAALSLGVVSRALGDDARADEWLARAGGNATQIRTALGAAQAFESAGSYEAAVATYEGMVARGAGSPDLDQRLAQMAIAANRLDAAVAAYRRLVAARPGVEQFWNGLGLAESRREAYEEAVASFERSLAINPKQPAVLTAIGSARVRMGRSDLAREAFTRALEIDPNYQPARQQLGALGGA
jgi:Flp pilus assembly protein TadD